MGQNYQRHEVSRRHARDDTVMDWLHTLNRGWLEVAANLLEEAALAAATYLEEHSITPFDAFHAGLTVTNDERIHTSDHIYDELGLDRLPLEPQE